LDMALRPLDEQAMSTASLQLSDRFDWWAVVTGAMQMGCIVAWVSLGCGCHFELKRALLEFVPILWGAYTFVCYRTTEERVVARFATLLAIAWLYVSWATNLHFLLR